MLEQPPKTFVTDNETLKEVKKGNLPKEEKLLLISIPLMTLYTANETWTRTTRKALIMISCTYTISLLLWPPWIVLWPYMEGRFIVEESSLCVVQFLVLGDTRTWQNQLATLFTSAAAFYIPVTKRERFSLLKFCTGRNVTTQSSSECISTEDSVGVLGGDDGGIGGEEEETCGLTTSNLDSIMAEQTAIELANNSCGDGGEFRQHENWESIIVAKAAERREALIEEERKKSQQLLQFQYPKGSSSTIPVGSFRSVGSGKMPIVELERTSRPSSVHTYNSIVIIEYPEGNEGNTKGGGVITSQRPSVRLSSQAEVESLSTRNSVERKFVEKEDLKEMKESPSLEEQRRLRLVKSAPGGRGGSIRLNNNNFSSSFTQQQQPNGVLMRKSEIQMIREEQMRQSEKERRRNERKQESKAAKTLSAILCAFIITCTPYHVIVCLEAFYPNSVPISLFTISYYLS
uniref:G protein-coupled receptor n=1 Tax=Meloidogyne javanica TaxID=6303 RepID=A0A915M5F5_MELJA